MAISIRKLFERQDIPNEVISLSNSLLNHPEGRGLTLREAHDQLLDPVSGDGWSRGCRRPLSGILGDLALVVPSWVPVDDVETRSVEGLLTKSKITHTDFPLKPWHTYYDWNFFIRPDRQYTYLGSPYNIEKDDGVIECEWDTAFLPNWAWPHEGERIWMVGRWIYDCGHPDESEADLGHKTELHPPRALAVMRREAKTLPGNTGPTRCSKATVFMGRDGGYWRQPLNDQDYTFDLYLPPRPYEEAEPVWKTEERGNGLPVTPTITPYPYDRPRALRVRFPLKGHTPHPNGLGAELWAGWSDPRGTESEDIKTLRLTFKKIHMIGDFDTGPDEWHIHIGAHGHWKSWEDIGGFEENLDFSVDLELHSNDKIHVTACGMEADLMHDRIGRESGLTWSEISDPNIGPQEARRITTLILGGTSTSVGDENDPIGYLFEELKPASDASTNTIRSDRDDYEIEYTIEER